MPPLKPFSEIIQNLNFDSNVMTINSCHPSQKNKGFKGAKEDKKYIYSYIITKLVFFLHRPQTPTLLPSGSAIHQPLQGVRGLLPLPAH